MRRTWKVIAVYGAVVASAACLLSAVLVAEVQDSRKDTIRITCEQQNLRHDRTIAALDELIAQIRDPARRLRALEGRSNTVALIDALAPRFDCEKRAELLVK